MQTFQFLLSYGFDSLLRPFQTIPPFWALIPFSILTSILLLLIFRYTSDQQQIRITKDTIKAYILELWLFRDDPRILLSAQGRILRLNCRYLALAMKPMLVSLIPVALLLSTLDGWFGFRPLLPGEEVIVSVQADDGKTEFLERATLTVSSGLTIETLPLRIPPTMEADWRVKAHQAGVYKVAVDLPAHRVEKEVLVSHGLARVSFSRLSSGFWQALLYPNEPPLPHQAGLQRIDVYYPS
jgi:hypothetical protein